jgi:hypothetical protein
VFEHAGMVYGVLPQVTLEALRASGGRFDALDLTRHPETHDLAVAEGREAHFFWASWPSHH